KRAVVMMIRVGWLVCHFDANGNHWIAERGKARNERDVALKLKDLAAAPPCWPGGPLGGLSEHQEQELHKALTSPVALLGGSPGRGKPHPAAAVIRAVVTGHGPNRAAVAAPTGRAGVRITEKMTEAGTPRTATTIHRLLKVRPSPAGEWRFEHDED